MWAALGKFLLGLVSNLLTLWLAKNAGKAEERAESAEKTLETIDRVNRPVTDDERERLWDENRAKYGRGVRDNTGAGLGKPD